MHNVLITGGAGYIGSVLTEALLTANDPVHVTVVDNFMWGQTSLNHLCHRDNLDIIRGDARDMRTMRGLLAKCDTFIPLAALVGAPLCDRRSHEAQEVNCNAIRDAFRCLSPTQRVLYPNTNSGYGNVPVGECTEETSLKPLSTYGRTKQEAENFVMERKNSVAFRLATVFGMSPRMRLDLLVNDFTYRAVMDGFIILYEPEYVRNYIHIRDVARVFLHAMMTKLPDGAYNVGLSTANLSKAELCKEIARVVNGFEVQPSRSGASDPDQRNYVVSNAKIERSGFLPCYTLLDGIVELVRGFQQFKRYQYGNV